MKRITLLSLSIILMISSCRDPEYIPLAQEFKDYVIFKPGSYWIYEDTISGALDCLVYKNIQIKVDEVCDEGYQELVEINYEVWSEFTDVFSNSAIGFGNGCSILMLFEIDSIGMYYFAPCLKEHLADNDSVITIPNNEHQYTGEQLYSTWQKNIGLASCDFRSYKNEIWKLKRYKVQQ